MIQSAASDECRVASNRVSVATSYGAMIPCYGMTRSSSNRSREHAVTHYIAGIAKDDVGGAKRRLQPQSTGIVDPHLHRQVIKRAKKVPTGSVISAYCPCAAYRSRVLP